jgi:hypothetical protein
MKFRPNDLTLKPGYYWIMPQSVFIDCKHNPIIAEFTKFGTWHYCGIEPEQTPYAILSWPLDHGRLGGPI